MPSEAFIIWLRWSERVFLMTISLSPPKCHCFYVTSHETIWTSRFEESVICSLLKNRYMLTFELSCWTYCDEMDDPLKVCKNDHELIQSEMSKMKSDELEFMRQRGIFTHRRKSIQYLILKSIQEQVPFRFCSTFTNVQFIPMIYTNDLPVIYTCDHELLYSQIY